MFHNNNIYARRNTYADMICRPYLRGNHDGTHIGTIQQSWCNHVNSSPSDIQLHLQVNIQTYTTYQYLWWQLILDFDFIVFIFYPNQHLFTVILFNILLSALAIYNYLTNTRSILVFSISLVANTGFISSQINTSSIVTAGSIRAAVDDYKKWDGKLKHEKRHHFNNVYDGLFRKCL